VSEKRGTCQFTLHPVTGLSLAPQKCSWQFDHAANALDREGMKARQQSARGSWGQVNVNPVNLLLDLPILGVILQRSLEEGIWELCGLHDGQVAYDNGGQPGCILFSMAKGLHPPDQTCGKRLFRRFTSPPSGVRSGSYHRPSMRCPFTGHASMLMVALLLDLITVEST
jgi:hypothetical protein